MAASDRSVYTKIKLKTKIGSELIYCSAFFISVIGFIARCSTQNNDSLLSVTGLFLGKQNKFYQYEINKQSDKIPAVIIFPSTSSILFAILKMKKKQRMLRRTRKS